MFSLHLSFSASTCRVQNLIMTDDSNSPVLWMDGNMQITQTYIKEKKKKNTWNTTATAFVTFIILFWFHFSFLIWIIFFTFSITFFPSFFWPLCLQKFKTFLDLVIIPSHSCFLSRKKNDLQISLQPWFQFIHTIFCLDQH